MGRTKQLALLTGAPWLQPAAWLPAASTSLLPQQPCGHGTGVSCSSSSAEPPQPSVGWHDAPAIAHQGRRWTRALDQAGAAQAVTGRQLFRVRRWCCVRPLQCYTVERMAC